MPQPVTISFNVAGVDRVRDAVANVNALLGKLDGTRARSAASAEAAERRVAVAAETSAKRKVLTAEQAEAQKIRIQNRSFSMEQSLRERSVRDAERAEQRKTRDAEAWAKRRERIVTNSLRMEQSATEAAARAIAHAHESRARAAGRVAGGAVSGVLGGATRLAGTVAAIGGGFTIADAASTNIRREEVAGQIVRSAATNPDKLTKADVRSHARAAAIAVGGTEDEALSALDRFVSQAGDVSSAVKMLQELSAESATAGAKMEDLGQTAGDVFAKLGDVNATKRVMRAWTFQGMSGAIDIRDMGSYGARLAGGAQSFAGDTAGNMITLGALAQLTRQKGTAASPAEATEAVASLADDIKANASDFTRRGVKVWADKDHTKLRAMDTIIVDALEKTGGNLGSLGDMAGRRGGKVLAALDNVWSEGGGKKGGAGAVRRAIGTLTSGSLTDDDLRRGVSDKLTENQANINRALEEFYKVIDSRLMPLLPQLIQSVSGLVPRFGDLLTWLTEEPWRGLGAVMFAAVTAEVGKALIGKTIEEGIAGVFAGIVGNGAGLTGLQLTASAVTLTAGSVALYTALEPVVKREVDRPFAAKQAVDAFVRTADNTTGAINTGQPGAVDEGKSTLDKAREKIGDITRRLLADDADDNPFDTGYTHAVLTGGFSKKANEDRAAAPALDALKAAAEQLEKALSAATKTANELASAGGAGRANPNDPSRQPVEH